MAESDQYYIEQCLNGQPDEFRHLVQRYQAALLAFLAGKTGNKAIAEDAAQETLVRAYFGLSGLKKRDSFYSWLLGIASRVAKEQLRGKIRFGDIDSAVQGPSETEQLQTFALERAISKLPDSSREVILLKFYTGLSCAEIAQQLEMPIGTVTKMLSRAYAKLRQLLSDKKEVQK